MHDITKPWNELYAKNRGMCHSLFFFFKFIYFERECVCAIWEGAEWEGERIPTRFCASMKPDIGLNPVNLEIVSWAKIKQESDA